ncbi:hypothetical protein BT96DRAFT_915833 [Gymnopus androsaceus JB14]|uniref:Cytochrome P450 n=1 Tax=Gymnopus androsaceus JB14 TaxID=1447944 RepID=A0A6A4I987_9AGAR|nr:hypothetical protein BT96DRAFT_915833 [Gymnopus androsaceus JB14]
MDTLNAEDLRSSATLIMKLWTSSKTASSGNEAELSKLNYHLRNLLPDAEKYPNPINFVIPTWETLWRLVATCLARVYDNAEYCHVFEEFLQDPTSRRFHDHSDSTISNVGYSDGLCADFIINETLRLHPPSRHISRSFPIETPSISIPVPKLTFVGGWPVLTLDWRHRTQIQTEVADIEAAHLSTDIWGMNALTFEPRRWALHADKDAPTLFVFGHGPLMCVGKKWAPMAAAIIVGAILECIKADGLEIVGGRSIGGREGWDDWMIQSFET